MRDGSRRFWAGATLGFLACWLGLPGTSRAQSSLFPDMTIRRSRVPCELEDPRITIFRRQYYGYFPTCWRRFPPGWACPCPNPDLPNWEMEKAQTPIQGLEAEAGPTQPPAGTAPGGTAPGTPPGTTAPVQPPEMPPLPGGTDEDLFNIPTNPPRQPNANPPLRELPETLPGGEVPGVNPLPERPGAAPGLGEPRTGDTASDAGPVLAPPATTMPALDSNPAVEPAAAPGAGIGVGGGPVLAPEVSPVPRRSLIGGFFSGLIRRR